MIARVPEPEATDLAAEADEYDRMDHLAVNTAFVNDFLQAVAQVGMEPRLRDGVQSLHVLDAGTGTAQIPILLGRQPVFTRTIAVDLSAEMLKLARSNIYAAGLQFSIALHQADCQALPFADNHFAAVMSNSIVHHLGDVSAAMAELVRVLAPGGLLFIRDLLRPETEADLNGLVCQYAGQATPPQRQMLADSLRAAWTLDEVRDLLVQFHLPTDTVTQTSDRHWTLAVVPKSKCCETPVSAERNARRDDNL